LQGAQQIIKAVVEGAAHKPDALIIVQPKEVLRRDLLQQAGNDVFPLLFGKLDLALHPAAAQRFRRNQHEQHIGALDPRDNLVDPFLPAFDGEGVNPMLVASLRQRGHQLLGKLRPRLAVVADEYRRATLGIGRGKVFWLAHQQSGVGMVPIKGIAVRESSRRWQSVSVLGHVVV
jgi:hypothetical protein